MAGKRKKTNNMQQEADNEALRKKAEERARLSGLEYLREEAPLVAELQAVDPSIAELWLLCNRPTLAPGVLEILLARFPSVRHEGLRMTLANIFQRKAARHGWPVLVAEFSRDPNHISKEQIGFALGDLVDAELLGEYLGLVNNKDHGVHRATLIPGLYKFIDQPRVQELLEKLRDDPDTAGVVKQCDAAVNRRKARKKR